MRTPSNRLILALAIGALVLQGCAQTHSTRPEAVQAPSASTQTAGTATASAAAISEKDGKPVVVANTKDNFEAVAAAVQRQMKPGGQFGFVSNAGRQKVDGALADMRALFDQYGSVDKMNQPSQTRLLADQNAINETLARYNSNRRICWKETPVGTHFPTTVCKTLGEIQSQKQNARNYMHQVQGLYNQGVITPKVNSQNSGH